jgi:TonB family protein
MRGSLTTNAGGRMLEQLPETGAARERRWSSVVPSVVLHLVVITAVVAAQAGGVEAPKPSIHIDTIVFTSPVPPDQPVGRAGSAGSSSTSRVPTVPRPIFDAPTIPETGTPTIWPSSGDSNGVDGLLTDGPSGTLASAPGDIIGEATVDEPVRVRVESVPRYPAALRAMGAEGVVEMEFVIDTTGRANLATAHVLSSPDERFTTAVRSALREARFVPGRYRGHAVPTLVRRAYHFQLENGR